MRRRPSQRSLVPMESRPPLPADRFIREEAPSEDAAPLDVLFVGGGPAGLAGAIELARLVARDAETGGDLGPIEIGVLEKSETLGEHCLSGAVINPAPFRELLQVGPTMNFRSAAPSPVSVFICSLRAARSGFPRRLLCGTMAILSALSARSSAGSESERRSWVSTSSPDFPLRVCLSRGPG